MMHGSAFSDVADSEEWMILNVQEMGFFKVNYDQKNWDLLIKQLQEQHTAIHPTNRAQVKTEARRKSQARLDKNSDDLT